MKKTIAAFIILACRFAIAEQCDIISITTGHQSVVENKVLQGRSNTGTIPGGFVYSITSMPGPVDAIYITAGSQVTSASGPVIDGSTPLTVSTTDINGSGASIRCKP